MKKFYVSALTAMVAMSLLAGCAWQVGGDKKVEPTIGQQLVDLKKAHDSGAISDQEYQTEKSKLLGKQ